MLFIHETFLVYKLKTFKNCLEAKHIVTIIATIYIFLSYVIFDQQLKITFRKSSTSRWKNPLSPKNSKSASPSPFLLTLKIFQAPLQKEGEDTIIAI